MVEKIVLTRCNLDFLWYRFVALPIMPPMTYTEPDNVTELGGD